MRAPIIAALLAITGVAAANGRPANVQSIRFQRGNPQHIVAGATFGALFSDDNGATWHWMCEAAVGYGGTYDPDYAYAASGAVFATTFDGLLVSRDRCTFGATPLGTLFASQVELGATNDVVHTALSDPANANIASSTDDGVTFPTSASLGFADAWWQSLAVAPSNTQRVYLTGYRLVDGSRITLVYTSDDGGASFTAGGTSGLTLSANSVINIAGVSPTTPTTVYAVVTYENSSTDALYVSTNAGASWTRLIGATAPAAALVRGNGDLLIAGAGVAKVSTDGGTEWTDLVSPPPISCLAEQPDGTVWACVNDFTPGAARIARTTDLATWTSALRFGELDAPVACAAGTVQHDTCEPAWCILRMQLGITADPTGCVASPQDGSVDAAIDAAPLADAGPQRRPNDEGCCQTSARTAPGTFLLALLVVVVLSARSGGSPCSRRRRHTRCPARDRTASAP